MQHKTIEYILTSKLVPEVIKVMMSQVWPSRGADSLRDSGRTRVAEVAVSQLVSGTSPGGGFGRRVQPPLVHSLVLLACHSSCIEELCVEFKRRAQENCEGAGNSTWGAVKERFSTTAVSSSEGSVENVTKLKQGNHSRNHGDRWVRHTVKPCWPPCDQMISADVLRSQSQSLCNMSPIG